MQIWRRLTPLLNIRSFVLHLGATIRRGFGRVSNLSQTAISVAIRTLDRAHAPLQAPAVQLAFFAILAAIIGIMFTVRATYVTSFRNYDMEAISFLIPVAADGVSAVQQQLLGCLNLAASEDSRYSEAGFTLATSVFVFAAILIGTQAVVLLFLQPVRVALQPGRLHLRWRVLFPYASTWAAILASLVAGLLLLGPLGGLSVMKLPEPSESVAFFDTHRVLPRWEQVQQVVNQHPGLMDVINGLGANADFTETGSLEACRVWASR